MSVTLTPQGWPRPRNSAGLPVPWISPAESLGETDERREAAAASGAICGVCGGDFAEDDRVYLLYAGAPAPPPGLLAERDGMETRITAIDNTFMHGRCCLLSLRHCPKLNELRTSGSLHAVVVAPDEVQLPYVSRRAHRARVPRLQGWVRAADARPVALEEVQP